MGDIVHTSHIRIYQDQPPERRAYIENFGEPVPYGVQGALREYYGAGEGPPIAATLDHIVAAVGG